jgi:hypothetical protein
VVVVHTMVATVIQAPDPIWSVSRVLSSRG